MDESTGGKYYYNSVTQETSWTNPNLSADDPAAWQEAVDESSGQTYYYNCVSQVTSWDRPAVLDKPVTAAAPTTKAAAAPTAPAASANTATKTAASTAVTGAASTPNLSSNAPRKVR